MSQGSKFTGATTLFAQRYAKTAPNCWENVDTQGQKIAPNFRSNIFTFLPLFLLLHSLSNLYHILQTLKYCTELFEIIVSKSLTFTATLQLMLIWFLQPFLNGLKTQLKLGNILLIPLTLQKNFLKVAQNKTRLIHH